ncbi:MAG: hypothetical protein CMO80_18960 [Verrucomicrobiales bacterium]|nr:hypothetical protein [Verrucomicrobiales bacterium]|tara:strand:+ start:6305 stop:6691 length:387 start_codon:yes stop_codon:yes gene_type:complete
MKKLLTAALALTCAFALTTSAVAEEKKAKKAKKEGAAKKNKERTVKGELICAHCALGKGDSCNNAIKVTNKKSGKEMIYFLSGDAASALGKGKGQKVIAKGKVERKGKGKEAKITLVASSLAVDKKAK